MWEEVKKRDHLNRLIFINLNEVLMTNDIVILRLVIEWTAQEEETNTWQDASLIWALTQITWRYSKSLLVTSSDLTRVRYSESLLVTSSDGATK